MANNLNDFLRSRATLGFEHFEFGSGLIASIEGSAASLRGTDSLAQVRHAINSGTDTIDSDTQIYAHAALTGANDATAQPTEQPTPEKSLVEKAVELMPNLGLADAVKMWVYGTLGISIVVIGLIALVMSTDTGKAAVKDAAKAAAV